MKQRREKMKRVLICMLCGIVLISAGVVLSNLKEDNIKKETPDDATTSTPKEEITEGSIDNNSITTINVTYNGTEYNLEDMAGVLFKDGWKIKGAMSQTYDLVNDKYDFWIEIKYPENSIEEAKELETSTGDINSAAAIEKLSNTKISMLEICENTSKVSETANEVFSVFGITLNTKSKDIPALLPTITGKFDFNHESDFQRANDYYKMKIDCIGDNVRSITIILY